MSRNILFMCTGNAARSQMAEALLRRRAGHVFEVFSAGTRPQKAVFPPVIEVMRELDLDLSAQRPKSLHELVGCGPFEQAITLCADAEKECPAALCAKAPLHWPTEDPAGVAGTPQEVRDACRRIRDRIDRRIRDWLEGQGVRPLL